MIIFYYLIILFYYVLTFRVPGNTAAITSLTEAVNTGGMETPDMAIKLLQRDPRWTDVNVISSLLKSFFRRLPDALLTTEMYPHFIEADKIDDPVQRMVKLRELVCKKGYLRFTTKVSHFYFCCRFINYLTTILRL